MPLLVEFRRVGEGVVVLHQNAFRRQLDCNIVAVGNLADKNIVVAVFQVE